MSAPRLVVVCVDQSSVLLFVSPGVAYGGYLSVDGGCYIDILQSMGMMGGSVVDEDWVWPWKGTPASNPAPESASAVKV